MNPSSLRLPLLSLAAAVFSLAFAQPAAPPAQSGVTIRTTTTLVQVNVVAHDAKGQAVADLKKEDFEVFDNGRPQTIATFAVEDSAKQVPRNLPANTFTNQAADSGGSRGGYSVILLDLLDIGEFRDQVFARQAVAKVINETGATERLALYVLDASGLRVICDFGTDRDLLLKRVAVLNGQASPYLQPASESSASISPGQDAGVGQDQFLYSVTAPPKVFSEAEGFIADWTIRTSLHSLEAIADHLAGVPPRKGLIWVSWGIPGSIDLAPMAAKVFPGAMKQTTVYSNEIERAIRKLTNADVAVYGVDPGGVWRDMLRSPERVILDQFASQTGGIAWHGNGLDTEMQAALSDVSYSYSLGYYAPPDYDRAKFHRLKVEVTRPGVKLRYREGYSVDTAASPSEDRKAKVTQALLSPVDNTSIPIAVKAVRKQNALSLRIALQPASLGLVRKGDHWQGKIELIARFAAEDGRESGSPSSKTVYFNLSQRAYEAALRDGLAFSKALDIPPRASRLRVLVRNDGSGEIGTLSIPLRNITGN